MENYHKNKIVVIGAGNVGEASAYTLMVRRQGSSNRYFSWNQFS